MDYETVCIKNRLEVRARNKSPHLLVQTKEAEVRERNEHFSKKSRATEKSPPLV